LPTQQAYSADYIIIAAKGKHVNPVCSAPMRAKDGSAAWMSTEWRSEKTIKIQKE